MARRASTVLKAWLFHVEITAWLVALGLIVAAELRWAGGSALLALGAHVVGRLWSRHSPVPMPYFMRWILLVPRGPHSPARVKRLLRPRSGERILEIGPGVGIHAIPIAAALRPDGFLSVLDVQREMLDDLARRAARRGIRNIVPSQGNAQSLPYSDAAFDAAYLVSVLGEIPSPTIALAELQRVLKMYQEFEKRGETRVCFLRITPGPVTFAYAVGRPIWHLINRMEGGLTKIELPTEYRS